MFSTSQGQRCSTTIRFERKGSIVKKIIQSYWLLCIQTTSLWKLAVIDNKQIQNYLEKLWELFFFLMEMYLCKIFCLFYFISPQHLIGLPIYMKQMLHDIFTLQAFPFLWKRGVKSINVMSSLIISLSILFTQVKV